MSGGVLPAGGGGGSRAGCVGTDAVTATISVHAAGPAFAELDSAYKQQRAAVIRARKASRRAAVGRTPAAVASGAAYDLGGDDEMDDDDGGFGSAFNGRSDHAQAAPGTGYAYEEGAGDVDFGAGYDAEEVGFSAATEEADAGAGARSAQLGSAAAAADQARFLPYLVYPPWVDPCARAPAGRLGIGPTLC